MPIGKNAVKRVTNSGYSAIVSKAPDMEKSEELVAVAKAETAVKSVKKSASSKTATAKAKIAPSKPTAAKADKKPETIATAKKSEKKTDNAPDGFTYVNIGRELPIYLL